MKDAAIIDLDQTGLTAVRKANASIHMSHHGYQLAGPASEDIRRAIPGTLSRKMSASGGPYTFQMDQEMIGQAKAEENQGHTTLFPRLTVMPQKGCRAHFGARS